MSKTITLRVDDELYEKFKEHAKIENRSISNFIETATISYIKETDLVSDFEMREIIGNESLVKQRKKGSADAKQRRGRFA
ncbi:MAG: CopG family transcriptional regulator [Spirochaetae bacterium HGW-Spirochaetae-6]|nr:MAG: CopG family transcriptional regulator [Spirochaetae bacterium HGW-Spirochaetae-6]